jgi:hypothetical protein
MEASAATIGVLVALIFIAASAFVMIRSYHRGRGRVITNDQRPAQPEPSDSSAATRDARR